MHNVINKKEPNGSLAQVGGAVALEGCGQPNEVYEYNITL